MNRHDRISYSMFYRNSNRNYNRHDTGNTCQYSRSNTVCIINTIINHSITRIPMRANGFNVHSPRTYRIRPVNAFGSSSRRYSNINPSRTSNGIAGKVKRSNQNRVSWRLWSNYRHHFNAADFCNSPADAS